MSLNERAAKFESLAQANLSGLSGTEGPASTPSDIQFRMNPYHSIMRGTDMKARNIAVENLAFDIDSAFGNPKSRTQQTVQTLQKNLDALKLGPQEKQTLSAKSKLLK